MDASSVNRSNIISIAINLNRKAEHLVRQSERDSTPSSSFVKGVFIVEIELAFYLHQDSDWENINDITVSRSLILL